MLSGTAWAEDEVVKATTDVSSLQYIYKIHCGAQNQSGYWGHKGGWVSESEAAQFAFIKAETDGQYYIYCVTDGTYMSYDQSNISTGAKDQAISVTEKAKAYPWAITTVTNKADSKSYLQLQPVKSDKTPSTSYANWFGGTSSTHSSMGFYSTSGVDDKGSTWTFVLMDCKSDDVATVTYNVSCDADSYTWKSYVKKGGEYPQPELFPAICCSSVYYSWSGVPEGTVSESVTKDVKLVENLPFEVSKDYDNAKWYALSISADKHKLNYIESDTKMSISSSTTEFADKDLFCFVGNIFNGFAIYNKAAGSTKLLSSSKTMSGTTGGSTYVIMTGEETAKTQSYLWDVTKSSSTFDSNGFYLGQHGVSSARMNERDGYLAYWTDNVADGSTFTVEAVNDDAILAAIDNLCGNVGEVGYPKSDIEVSTNLKTAKEAIDENTFSTYVTLRKAYDAFIASTDVVTPVANKFYTLQCTTSGCYMLTTLSKSDGKTARLATAKATDDNVADRIFYFADGKYMVGYNDGYYVGNTTTDSNPFLGHATVGVTSGSVFTFGSAKVSEGSLYVNFNNGGRGLYGNNVGYVDASTANNTADGYRFKVTEVTELPLTIGSNGWSSFSAPVAVCKPTDANVKVYYAPTAPTDNKLVLEEITNGIIPANTGVLVSGTAGNVVNFSTETGDASANTLEGNKLVCNWYVNTVGDSDEETAKTDGKYAFATKTTNGVKTTGFMKLLTAVTLPGHKCYLNTATAAAPSSASAQFIPISLTDDPTGIESAETTTASDANAPIYDLQGRKVNGTKKGGMYIQNGKVFIAM